MLECLSNLCAVKPTPVDPGSSIAVAPLRTEAASQPCAITAPVDPGSSSVIAPLRTEAASQPERPNDRGGTGFGSVSGQDLGSREAEDEEEEWQRKREAIGPG